MIRNRQRALIFGLIGLGLLIAGFFGMRSFLAFREFRRHGPPPLPALESSQIETDPELIRDWMTIGFLSHTYRLPPKALYEALGIRPNGNEDKSLKQLNDEYFPDQPGYVLETVKVAIQAFLPPPTGIPPATAIPAVPPATAIP